MKKATDIMSKTGKWLLVFGFIFSQLSFPISVLADEVEITENNNQEVETIEGNNQKAQLIDDVQEPTPTNEVQPEPIITINGEARTEYTIEENTTVNVVLEYQKEGETKLTTVEEKFDFSDKLYGTYEYTFEEVEKTITIIYEGDNAELLNQYKNIDYTNVVYNTESGYNINVFGNETVTVADIKTQYYDVKSFEDRYLASVEVKKGEQPLEDTDTINNGYQLVITNNQTELKNTSLNPTTYSITINRTGDLNNDGIIDSKDQYQIIGDIVHEKEVTEVNDINQDNELNILDATHQIYTNNTSTKVPATLSNTLIPSMNNIFVGEEVEVKLFVKGFDVQSLYGIEGLLSYNEEVLEIVGVYALEKDTEDVGTLNLINNKFAFVFDGFNSADIAAITFVFKAVGIGNSNIVIINLAESYGELFKLESDNIGTTVSVIEDNAKGGDEEEKTDNSTPNTTATQSNSTEATPSTTTNIVPVQTVVRNVVLSSDNYIKSLTIEGYEIDFNMYTYEYSIKVANDVKSLNMNIVLNNSNAIYYVEGNTNFKVGENTVTITVTAEDGSTKTYTIKVEKEKKETKKTSDDDEEEIAEENSTSKTIIIILIILVIIGLIYVIFKDDEEDEKDSLPNNQNKNKQKDTKKGNKK